MAIIQSNKKNPIDLLADESIFSTSNQVLGVRGNFAEGYGNHYKTIRGTYINGVFGEYDYHYGEKGYAFPEKGQIIVNLPDPQTIYVKVNKEPVDLDHAELVDLSREYDTLKGRTYRKALYRTKEGYEFTIEERRLTSLEHKEVFFLDYQITSHNFQGSLELYSTLNANVSNVRDEDDPRMSDVQDQLFDVVSISEEDRHILLQTLKTNFDVYVTMSHNDAMDYQVVDQAIVGKRTLKMDRNTTYRIQKTVVYTSSKYHENLKKDNEWIQQKILGIDLYQAQVASINNAHIHDTVQVFDEEMNNIVHYNLYQLYTSGGANEHSNIPAKGLSGEGYEGHYFWDTDIYMFMFFLMNNKKLAKNLLMFRYNTLDQAIERARELGHKRGAKYPWRTIDGREVSPYFPAGTAQYHINGAIAHSFIQYYHVTHDREFILKKGFKVLYETAIIYLEIGHFYKGAFHINSVTGPDEYTAIVNNNFYTNKMAQHHMRFVLAFYEEHKEELSSMVDEAVMEEMRLAEQQMVLPFDKEKNIHAQDDHFLAKKKLDLEHIKKPMLLHYHPLSIYRAQVCKQADVVLAHYLLDDEPLDVMKNSLDYYEEITTHDSSLSKCIFSIMYARTGNKEKAYEYFNEQLRMDTDNTLSNTHHGLHVANMGGTYLTIVSGFLGLRTNNGLSVRPYCPSEWRGYQVNLEYRGVSLSFEVKNTLRIKVSKPIDLWIYGKQIHINDSYEQEL